MAKHATDIDVIKDLYLKLVEGGLDDVITGRLYLKKRPPAPPNCCHDKEDCVVSFLSGRDGQMQTGVVTCNIFVPNAIVSGTKGYKMENVERIEIITDALNSIIHDGRIMQKGRYLWKPNTMVSTFELEQADEHSHFVHVELQFTNNTCYDPEMDSTDGYYGAVS